MTVECDLYLRLSDFRDDDDGFEGRERRLRAAAGSRGWTVASVIVENDLMPEPRNGNGRRRPASAFKRRKMRTPSGRTEWRVDRPGFRVMLGDLMAGRVSAILAEDLDRACRDPRDLEDLVDAVAERGATAASLSGSLALTNGGTDAEITMARVMVTMANKASRDTARRVADSRERKAEQGIWGGGRRPYGYAPNGVKGHLAIVPAEASELARAAEGVLTGASLKAAARSLRERGVPTVTGVQWSAEILRDVLVKPAVAGLAAHTKKTHDPDAEGGWREVTTLHTATWAPILPREQWEAIRGILLDPSRNTKPDTGNAPRWLLSGIALCGVCDDGKTSVNVSGGRPKSPGYICQEHSHLRRLAPAADELVGMKVCERLSLPDADTLLAPEPGPGVDVRALRLEAAALRERLTGLALAFADDGDGEALAAGKRRIKARQDEIAAQLAAATGPDPLAEFRGQPDPLAVWEGLSLERQRAIVRELATVTLLRSTRRGRGFDPDSVRIEFRHAGQGNV